MSNIKPVRPKRINEKTTYLKCQSCGHIQRGKRAIKDTICSVCLKKEMKKND